MVVTQPVSPCLPGVQRAELMARPSCPSQACAGIALLGRKYGKFPISRPASNCHALAMFFGLPILFTSASREKTPGTLGFLEWLAGDFAFCRFCHFRVLTAKTSPPITRLVADEPARRAPAATKSERADVLPGNRKKHVVPKN